MKLPTETLSLQCLDHFTEKTEEKIHFYWHGCKYIEYEKEKHLEYPISEEIKYTVSEEKDWNDNPQIGINMFNGLEEHRFLIEEKDFIEFEKYYKCMNKARHRIKKEIENYHNEELLEIAENLINLIDQDVFCDRVALLIMNSIYLDFYSVEPGVYFFSDYLNVYNLSYMYDKELRELCTYDDIEVLFKKLAEVDTYIQDYKNITKEKVKQEDCFFIDALSWRIISEQLIKHYAEIWELYYKNTLGINYDEVGEREYIRQFYLNEKIETEKAKGVLIYYLLNKKKISFLKLYQEFDKYVELFDEIEKNKYIEDRKNLLMTKQRRKYVPHIVEEELEEAVVEELVKEEIKEKETVKEKHKGTVYRKEDFEQEEYYDMDEEELVLDDIEEEELLFYEEEDEE